MARENRFSKSDIIIESRFLCILDNQDMHTVYCIPLTSDIRKQHTTVHLLIDLSIIIT